MLLAAVTDLPFCLLDMGMSLSEVIFLVHVLRTLCMLGRPLAGNSEAMGISAINLIGDVQLSLQQHLDNSIWIVCPSNSVCVD